MDVYLSSPFASPRLIVALSKTVFIDRSNRQTAVAAFDGAANVMRRERVSHRLALHMILQSVVDHQPLLIDLTISTDLMILIDLMIRLT